MHILSKLDIENVVGSMGSRGVPAPTVPSNVDANDIAKSALICVGALVTIAATEGTALLLGAGAAAIGSCVDTLDKIDPSYTAYESFSRFNSGLSSSTGLSIEELLSAF